MGLNIGFSKSCIIYGDRCGNPIYDKRYGQNGIGVDPEATTNSGQGTLNVPKSAPSPNPNPLRWKLLKMHQCENAYVLLVKYLDCTNFEGQKIMVYSGKYEYVEQLDPHFSKDKHAPIARFKPDSKGWNIAIKFAESL